MRRWKVMMAFLKNGWYAAAYSREIKEKPLRRIILGEAVVLFRDGEDKPAALEDKCPHRFAPLSKGYVIEGELQCPYHGLRFGRDGACAYNPHYDALPKAAKVRSYPVMEKYGVLWLWPGDPDQVDPSKLPDFSFLEQPGFKAVSGYLHIKGNYQLVVDNLLDLTHAPYLHSAFAIPGMSTEERLKNTKTELVREEARIIAKRWRLNFPPNGPTRNLFGFDDERMDSRSHMHWHPPSLIYFDAGASRLGETEEKGLCLPAMHAITPETDTTCHYFFSQARNMKLNDPSVDEKLFAILENAFRYEDEPMIEAQQEAMGDVADIMDLNPVLLRTDAAPLEARRILTRLIEAEKAS